jgi:hypothetical protein
VVNEQQIPFHRRKRLSELTCDHGVDLIWQLNERRTNPQHLKRDRRLFIAHRLPEAAAFGLWQHRSGPARRRTIRWETLTLSA